MIFKTIQQKVPVKRIWHCLNLNLRVNSGSRTKYLKTKKIFRSIGNNVYLQIKKVPLYPKLISFGNNIVVASNVLFLTHDAIHSVFNRTSNKENKEVNEKIGCINIEDNCFIGANSIILHNVNIGPNAIVAAGSVVTKDVLPGTIVGGVPAKKIGTFKDLMVKRIEETRNEPPVVRNESQNIPDSIIDKYCKEFLKNRNKVYTRQ